MIKTEYICDRCKSIQYTSDQFWKIGVSCAYFNSTFSQPTKVIQVCRECAKHLNFFHATPKADKSPDPLTIEDLVREIISIELDNRK